MLSKIVQMLGHLFFLYYATFRVVGVWSIWCTKNANKMMIGANESLFPPKFHSSNYVCYYKHSLSGSRKTKYSAMYNKFIEKYKYKWNKKYN